MGFTDCSNNHQGNALIAPVQIAMLTKKGKSALDLPTDTGAAAEIFTNKQVIDSPFLFQILQLRPNLPPDFSAPSTGTVAVDQG